MTISEVGKARIELFADDVDYFAVPMNPNEGESGEQAGKVRKFRVTTTDDLNYIFGIVSWPKARPEIIHVESINGLEKYKRLERAGRISIIQTGDGKWLVELNVMKFGSKDYPTNHSSNWPELDSICQGNAKQLLLDAGAISAGTREAIDHETAKTRNNLAIKVNVQAYEPLAVAFTLTKVLSIMHDLGQGS